MFLNSLGAVGSVLYMGFFFFVSSILSSIILFPGQIEGEEKGKVLWRHVERFSHKSRSSNISHRYNDFMAYSVGAIHVHTVLHPG